MVLKAKIHEFRSKVAHLSPFCEVSLLEYICVNARNGELDAQDFRNDTEIVPKCRIKVKREANPEIKRVEEWEGEREKGRREGGRKRGDGVVQGLIYM